MSGVVSRVLDAAEHGATTRTQIAIRTGLDPVVVDACVDHLLRAGLIAAAAVSSGCPDTGCGGCATVSCPTRHLPHRDAGSAT